MKFKVDENLPIDLAELLKKEGYDALTVLDQNLIGKPDATIASVCQTEKRTSITLDTDFADIREYPPNQYPGIIVLRIEKQDKSYVLNLFNRVMRLFIDQSIEGQLWIVEEEKVRIRS